MDTLRALIVEDSPVILESLQALLEELELVKVVAIASAEDDACAWMDGRSNGCDVCIIDLFLTRGNGLGILQHMQTYRRPPERVVLTNYATVDVRSRCKALGAEAVFDKSTEIQELIDWLSARGACAVSRHAPCSDASGRRGWLLADSVDIAIGSRV